MKKFNNLYRGVGMRLYWEVDPFRYRRFYKAPIPYNQWNYNGRSFRKWIVGIGENYYYFWCRPFPKVKKLVDIRGFYKEIAEGHIVPITMTNLINVIRTILRNCSKRRHQ